MSIQPVIKPFSLSHSESIGLSVGNPTPLFQLGHIIPNLIRIPVSVCRNIGSFCCFSQGCWVNWKGSQIYLGPALIPCEPP